ncbi:MAG: Fe-S cluster assembly protein SufD [Ignavibacteria bacterium]|nr:Fe-S cluster assembly protein SufD [Ignavibacteria bacterium]
MDLKTQIISEYNESSKALKNGFVQRTEAITDFERTGFPTKKNEDWRFTNINAIVNGNFTSKAKSVLDAKYLDSIPEYNFDANIVLIHNGNYSKEFSKIKNPDKNITIANLFDTKDEIIRQYFGKYALSSEGGFTALNTSMANAGTLVHIKKNASLEKPLIILNITDAPDCIANIRNLIVLESSAKAEVSEIYYSKGKNFSNTVTEIILNENSELHYNKIQNSGSDAYHVGTTRVMQEKHSRLFSNTITLGGSFTRNNLDSLINGEGIDCYFRGLYLVKDDQFIDNHTLADHAKPGSHSNELYRGILDESGSAVFNGKIMVRQDAQKTNAYQTNNNILLSNDCSVNSKPQLEIFADDVKCSHGATTGQIDEEEIFYLKSRGIGEQRARKMLLSAFAHSVIDEIKNEEIKALVSKTLDEKLG